MNWLLFAAFAGLASSGFNITNRIALKDQSDATAFGWWFELVRTSFFLLVFLFSKQPSFNPASLLPLLLVGLSELFSVYVYMKMHSSAKLSLSSVLIRLRVIWSPILAWLFIGERLTLPEYLGILLIFLGIAIVTSPKQIRHDRGVKLALLFSFSNGLLTTAMKNATLLASSDLIIIAQGLIPLFTLPLLMQNGFRRIWQTAKNKMPQITLSGSFNIVSSFLIVEAMHLTDASKVVGVYQTFTLASVFYGIYILKETDKIPQKILGSLIVLLGVLAIII